MSDEVRSPAQRAAEIDAARDRLIAFAAGCTPEQWRAAPLEGDPRPVGVIVDHVAHAYEYMGDWMRRILDGEDVRVTGDMVNPAALNASATALGPEFNIFSVGGQVVATPPAFINFRPPPYLRPFTIP